MDGFNILAFLASDLKKVRRLSQSSNQSWQVRKLPFIRVAIVLLSRTTDQGNKCDSVERTDLTVEGAAAWL